MSGTGFTFNPSEFGSAPYVPGQFSSHPIADPRGVVPSALSGKPAYTLAWEGLLALALAIHDLIFRCLPLASRPTEQSQSWDLCPVIAEKYANQEDIQARRLNAGTLITDLTRLHEDVRRNKFMQFFQAAQLHGELSRKAWQTISTQDFVNNHLLLNGQNFGHFLQVLRT